MLPSFGENREQLELSYNVYRNVKLFIHFSKLVANVLKIKPTLTMWSSQSRHLSKKNKQIHPYGILLSN